MGSNMNVIATIEECRSAVRQAQQSGKVVGLVPTMGALHEGHMSLVRAAKARCDFVVVTIFVNPTQFGPNEDFNAYPRPLVDDLVKFRGAGVDAVFAPSVEVMYGPDSRTTVRVARLTDGLCGPHRPGHFDGVATVVAKLFHIAPADAAFFGEKDYQQLMVIRQMATDLNFAMEIVGCPTLREPDGLAMSSRNAYLSPTERAQAVSISRALFQARDAVAAGNTDAKSIMEGARNTLVGAGIHLIDYVDAVDANTLAPLVKLDRPARCALPLESGKHGLSTTWSWRLRDRAAD
jgi:pantoate--beta-alanine ligase